MRVPLGAAFAHRDAFGLPVRLGRCFQILR